MSSVTVRTNYRKLCEARLATYCKLSGNRIHGDGPHDGSLFLSLESGVKRLRQGVFSSAIHDLGPAFTTWEGLYYFLTGMVEAEYLRDRS